MYYVYLYHKAAPLAGRSYHLIFTAERFTEKGMDYFHVYLPGAHAKDLKRTWVAAPTADTFVQWIHDWSEKASTNFDSLWISDALIVDRDSFKIRGQSFTGVVMHEEVV